MRATLTDRQREFIARFHDRDDPRRTWCCATRAAEAAGYRWPDKQGPRLLTFPAVKAEIERHLAAYVVAMREEHKQRLRREMGRIFASQSATNPAPDA